MTLVKIKQTFRLIRVNNCLFAALTTLLGYFYLNDLSDILPAFIAALSTFLVAAGGYAINDFFDYRVDMLNRPDRPLPSGILKLKFAKRLSLALFALGIVLAIYLKNVFCVFLVCLNSVSLYYYGYYFKKTFLAGNFIVAWNACSTFIYGAIIGVNSKYIWSGNIIVTFLNKLYLYNIFSLVVFSFVYTLIREWVKSIEDYDGDKAEKVRTVAIVLGKEKTWLLINITTALLLPFIILLRVGNMIGISFSLFMGCMVVVPAIESRLMLKKSQDKFTVRKIQFNMKVYMLCVIIGYIIHDILIRIL